MMSLDLGIIHYQDQFAGRCLLSQEAALSTMGYSPSRYPLYAKLRFVVAFHVQLPKSGNPLGEFEFPSPLAEGGKKC